MYRWAIGGIMALLLIGIWLYDSAQQARTEAYLQSEALKDLSTLRANLEGTVNSTLQLTQGLIAYVATHPDLERESFEAIAGELMAHTPHIRNMTLVQGERIAYVYPYEGNEAALGLNIFTHPDQKHTAKRVRESGQTVVGGPYELVQGGEAFVSRTPIYIAQGLEGAGEYWGMSSVPLDLKSVYAAAGVDPDNPRLAIRGKDALGAQGALFLGDRALFQSDRAVYMDVMLPGGSWQLALLPQDPPLWPRVARLGAGVLLLLVYGVMAWRLVQSRLRLYRLNEELSRSESSYRMIANHLSEAVFKTDRHGAIAYISPAASRLFGLERFEGVLWVTLFESGDRKQAEALFQTALAHRGVEQSATFRVRAGDRVRWIEIHARALEDEAGEGGLVGTMRDETARIQAQQALTRSRDDLVESQRIARLGSWEIDLDNRMMTLSCEHRRLMEMERTDLPMTILLEHFLKLYVHPDDADAFREAIARADASRHDYRDSFEYRLVTAKTHTLFIWATLRAKGDGSTICVGVSQDISPIKQMQSALLASESRYRGFIENLSDGVLAIQGGVICYANRAMAKMVGCAVEDLVGAPLQGYVAPEDQAMVQHYRTSRLEGGVVPDRYELRLVLCDGAIRTARINASLTRWDGQPAVIATVTDISEQKAYEKLLTLQKQQHETLLVQQSKMAVMGEMIAAIIHQFKQPLSALSLILQELGEEARARRLDTELVLHAEGQGLEQVEYMNRTADDFHNFLKPDKSSGRFSPLEAIKEVQRLLSRRLKAAHAEVRYDEQAQACTISGVRNEFKQVALNLMGNACDAIARSRARGELPATKKGEIIISVTGSTEAVEVCFEDNGGGIDPLLLERIFEPYFTTKGESEGTGVGLYMSRTIIESGFGGRIWAENGPKGARFRMTLRP